MSSQVRLFWNSSYQIDNFMSQVLARFKLLGSHRCSVKLFLHLCWHQSPAIRYHYRYCHTLKLGPSTDIPSDSVVVLPSPVTITVGTFSFLLLILLLFPLIDCNRRNNTVQSGQYTVHDAVGICFLYSDDLCGNQVLYCWWILSCGLEETELTVILIP